MQANQRRDFSSSENHISSLLHLRLLTVAEAQLHLARPSVSQLATCWPEVTSQSRVAGNRGRRPKGQPTAANGWPSTMRRCRSSRQENKNQSGDLLFSSSVGVFKIRSWVPDHVFWFFVLFGFNFILPYCQLLNLLPHYFPFAWLSSLSRMSSPTCPLAKTKQTTTTKLQLHSLSNMSRRTSREYQTSLNSPSVLLRWTSFKCQTLVCPKFIVPMSPQDGSLDHFQ